MSIIKWGNQLSSGATSTGGQSVTGVEIRREVRRYRKAPVNAAGGPAWAVPVVQGDRSAAPAVLPGVCRGRR